MGREGERGLKITSKRVGWFSVGIGTEKYWSQLVDDHQGGKAAGETILHLVKVLWSCRGQWKMTQCVIDQFILIWSRYFWKAVFQKFIWEAPIEYWQKRRSLIWEKASPRPTKRKEIDGEKSGIKKRGKISFFVRPPISPKFVEKKLRQLSRMVSIMVASTATLNSEPRPASPIYSSPVDCRGRPDEGYYVDARSGRREHIYESLNLDLESSKMVGEMSNKFDRNSNKIRLNSIRLSECSIDESCKSFENKPPLPGCSTTLKVRKPLSERSNRPLSNGFSNRDLFSDGEGKPEMR